MKHRNPTRQHALLALLASLSLSGCQWDSVLYDSYIAAFGENGAGEFDTCENMEYILVRDTASGSNSSKKLERSLCCEDTDPCDPSAETLQKNPLCIAFKFDKCPLTASRCMVEKIIKEGLDHNLNPTYTEDFQTYCAEAICQPDEIECNLEFNWTEEINSTNDGNDTENIETTQSIDKKLRFFTCINPTDDKTCGASCPPPTTITSKDEINLSNLSNYFINQIDCSSTNGTCNQTQNTNDSSNEENPDEPQYLYTCNCPEHHINCDNKCIDPSTDEYCGITSCAEIDKNIPKCKSGLKCTNTQTNGNAPKYECKCPENTIECNGECINPDTDTRYCGAKGKCTSEESSSSDYKGERCGENFQCVNKTCQCNLGYQTCSEKSANDNIVNDRASTTCVPQNINEQAHKELISNWNFLRFDTNGCTCKKNYKNKDNDDSNGCETAQQRLECGTVSVDAVNCVEKYHAINDESTTCNDQLQCEIKKCQPGYNLVEYNKIQTHIEKSYLQVDNSYLNKLPQNGNGCILNSQTCCGEKCEICTEGKTCLPTKISTEKYDYQCSENICNEDEIPCLGGCLTKTALKNLHITEQCTCENGYDSIYVQNLLSYCQPTEETLCKLKGETYKYCFGQCLDDVKQKDAHIKPNSENCECEDGYQQVIFGMVEAGDSIGNSNNTDIDNSLPGYCKKIIDQKEFCGYEQLNCTQYENASDIDKDSITCKDYACYFDCKNKKCNWDNNLANGCEASLPKGFKTCDSCEDNAVLSIRNNNKRCVRRGKGWADQYWTADNVNYYCNNCSSGDYCCIEYNYYYGYYYGICKNNWNCY